MEGGGREQDEDDKEEEIQRRQRQQGKGKRRDFRKHRRFEVPCPNHCPSPVPSRFSVLFKCLFRSFDNSPKNPTHLHTFLIFPFPLTPVSSCHRGTKRLIKSILSSAPSKIKFG